MDNPGTPFITYLYLQKQVTNPKPTKNSNSNSKNDVEIKTLYLLRMLPRDININFKLCLTCYRSQNNLYITAFEVL
jgi:hypothetical protein